MKSPLQLISTWRLISAAMLSSILLTFAATAQAQFTYVTNGGALKITGYTGTDGNLVIPATTNGYPVTGIATNVFYGDTYVTNLVIPASVSYIGSNSFGGCIYLLNATVPGAITNEATAGGHSPYVYVFQNNYITNITIAPGSTYVCADAFFNFYPKTNDYVSSLRVPFNVTVPFGVTNIQTNAFTSCGVQNISLPESLLNIGYGAFGNLGPFFTSITIPASVTNLDYEAFSDDSSLGQVIFEGGTVNIGQLAFNFCTGLTNVNFQTMVATSIGTNAFANCTALPNLVLTNGVASIGYSAFTNCTALTNVNLGVNTTFISTDAFWNCTSLASVTVPGYVNDGNPLEFTAANGYYHYIFNPVNPIDTINIAAGSTFIGTNAFTTMQEVNLVIPDGVTNIQFEAFKSNKNLEAVTLPDSLTTIGDQAFSGCYVLTALRLPSHLVSIGINAFTGSFSSITIPGSVTNIGSNAFGGAAYLSQVYFTGNAPDAGTNTTVFNGAAAGATVYYLPGTTGWGASYDGLPTALWNPRATALTNSGGQFGFTITGPTNAAVVVLTCTNLANPVWLPVTTTTLSASGTALFSDPQWTNHPTQFYRFTTP